MTTRHALLLALVGLFVSVGCGSASPPEAAVATAPAPQQHGAMPAESATATEPEPITVEEAEAQVKSARARLENVRTLKVQSGAADERNESEACRALHSLERASKALCRLAGAQDARCKEATDAYEKDRTRIVCR